MTIKIATLNKKIVLISCPQIKLRYIQIYDEKVLLTRENSEKQTIYA